MASNLDYTPGPKERRVREEIAKLNKETIEKADLGGALFSRQRPDEDDPFYEDYSQKRVHRPPYDFEWLYRLYEESDSLQANIAAETKNTVGMGWTLSYLGEDQNNITDEAKKEKEFIDDFFDQVNEEESWQEILNRGREDYGVLGNNAIEAIRDENNELSLLYHHPYTHLRVVPIDDKMDYHTLDVEFRRGGKDIKIPVTRVFRRFAKKLKTGKLRYFKEFGDPRPLYTDGTREKKDKTAKKASEIIWFKNHLGSNVYGLPTWIGCTFDVAGRRNAQALNWDLMKSQGIAPMAVIVEGKMTDDSWDEVWNMIMGAKGVENFNKIWVLQVESRPQAIGKSGGASIRFENLSNIQKNDQMFNMYLDGTHNRIRMAFRQPPAFIGETGAYSYSTLSVAKTMGEEQVYGPEKILHDRRVNLKIFKMGWKIRYWRYKTKGPEVSSPEELRAAVNAFSSTGLSFNNSIGLINLALGTDFSTFQEKWAEYPISMVMRLLDRAQLKGLEEISVPQTEEAAGLLGQGTQGGEEEPPGGYDEEGNPLDENGNVIEIPTEEDLLEEEEAAKADLYFEDLDNIKSIVTRLKGRNRRDNNAGRESSNE